MRAALRRRASGIVLHAPKARAALGQANSIWELWIKRTSENKPQAGPVPRPFRLSIYPDDLHQCRNARRGAGNENLTVQELGLFDPLVGEHREAAGTEVLDFSAHDSLKFNSETGNLPAPERGTKSVAAVATSFGRASSRHSKDANRGRA